MTLDEEARPRGLFVAGLAALLPSDGAPARFRSVALLSPDEPAFWPLFQASPEARDGRPDPLDRWSRRVAGRLARLRGKLVLPSDGPPFAPFQAWALRSGRCWASPVGLLVHEERGLWISFRGAILLPEEAPVAAGVPPCPACPAPCLLACPPRALTAQGYDVPPCRAFLAAEAACRDGCLVRRSCPLGASRRSSEQSKFHMDAFR